MPDPMYARKLDDEQACYAVVLIRSGEPIYTGRRVVMAAHALEPRTCFGKAATQEAALAAAQAEARRLRMAGWDWEGPPREDAA